MLHKPSPERPNWRDSYAMRLHEAHLQRRARLWPVAPPKVVVSQPDPEPGPESQHLPESAPVLAWEEIMRQVCQRHQVTRPLLVGTTRQHGVVVARHELFYRLHRERGMSFAQIGRMLGGFDHTTVRHGVRRHAERLAGKKPNWKSRSTWTPERRRLAELMRSAGATNQEIGQALGVSRNCISAAFLRWKRFAADRRSRAERMAEWAARAGAV